MRLLIGPANYAGQATELAHSINSSAGSQGWSAGLAAPKRSVRFKADFKLPLARWAVDPMWRARWRRYVVRTFDAVILDGGLPLTRGGLAMDHGFRPSRRGLLLDLMDLRSSGVSVALLFHGSEIRDPDKHRDREMYSPFHHMDLSTIERLRRNVVHTRQVIDQFHGPIFVTTADLLLDCPQATWVPVVCQGDRWQSNREPQFARPRVLNAPSSEAFAGTAKIDLALQRLHATGMIDYVRMSNVAPSQMPNLVKGADIVIDKYGMGIYGVIAVEAMFAGRLVLGHVSDQVRGHVNQGEHSVPVVEISPDTIENVIQDITSNPKPYLARAKEGVEFALSLHDGQASSRIIRSSFKDMTQS
jgi:hypothetical protein